MIQLPARSITRFFIPMIDVLTLLFCIYLLMPLASNEESAESEADRVAREQRIKELEAERTKRGGSQELPDRLREELEALRRERARALEKRISFRVLEVDAKDGHLFYRAPNPVPINNANEAQRLMKADREVIGPEKELCYVVLAPRVLNSGYPTPDDERKYRAWFKDVVLTFDYAGTGLAGGKR
jgi:hypothetical protein